MAVLDAGDDQIGMRDHMAAGDAWKNFCKLKILYENSWVPQKCGTYEIIENRYHKYHNVVLSVVLCGTHPGLFSILFIGDL